MPADLASIFPFLGLSPARHAHTTCQAHVHQVKIHEIQQSEQGKQTTSIKLTLKCQDVLHLMPVLGLQQQQTFSSNTSTVINYNHPHTHLHCHPYQMIFKIT